MVNFFDNVILKLLDILLNFLELFVWKSIYTLAQTIMSSRKKINQSDDIILDNRDLKESIADFVRALNQKNTYFPGVYIFKTFWKHLNNCQWDWRLQKQKMEELESVSNS